SSNWTAETNNKSKRIGSGRRAFYPEAEKRLYMWIIEQRKQALAVTYEIMQNRMMEILQQPDMVALYDDSAKTFKMSHRWTELLEKFYEHITQLKSLKFFELGNILNMDETPVWFDMAGNFTVNLKGEKTVHIRATGNDKNRFTGKRLTRKEQKRIPAGIVVWFQANGWMDTNLMIKYVDYLHELRLKNGTRNKPTMLVYDSFKGHLEDSVKKWHNWMGKGGAGNTAAGNLRRARIGDVCTWVKNSWEKLPNEMIVESFKTCKISNNSNELNSDLE
ncbi:8686_t:CDS:2, partial [Gigaspora rosea]